MASPDQVAAELHRLVLELQRRRDVGLPRAPLPEQKAHREGFTAAMRLVASSALLVQLLEHAGSAGDAAAG